MSALSLRLPSSIHQHIREIANLRKILANVPKRKPIFGDEL